MLNNPLPLSLAERSHRLEAILTVKHRKIPGDASTFYMADMASIFFGHTNWQPVLETKICPALTQSNARSYCQQCRAENFFMQPIQTPNAKQVKLSHLDQTINKNSEAPVSGSNEKRTRQTWIKSMFQIPCCGMRAVKFVFSQPYYA